MAQPLEATDLIPFEGPILDALQAYSDLTDGRVTFENPDPRLVLTPDKPNSARSLVPVSFYNQPIGNMAIIAFAPGDGTGDESAFKLADISTGKYPQRTGVVPRSKAAVHTEAHFTIATQKIDTQVAPVLFSGSLDLLGFRAHDPKAVKKIGRLGSGYLSLVEQHAGNINAQPLVTYTVGYDSVGEFGNRDARFADPHAVFNPFGDIVQVCGFLAITPEQASKYLAALRILKAKDPRPRAL